MALVMAASFSAILRAAGEAERDVGQCLDGADRAGGAVGIGGEIRLAAPCEITASL